MGDRKLRTVAAVAVGTSLAALIILAALQYSLPRGFVSILGTGWRCVAHFKRCLWMPPYDRLPVSEFVLYSRILISVAWLAYGVAVLAVIRSGAPRVKTTLMVAAPMVCLFAVCWPPSYSADVYGYAAFARMHVLYGMNPYTHVPQDLREVADPVGQFARFHYSSIYGPLWTLLSSWVVFLLKYAGLWWQIVGLKALAGGALLSVSVLAGRLADAFSPGTRNLTTFAVALNPLFLMEGPGNGHNDFVMMVFLLSGILLLRKQNHVTGSLMLGASVAVKFVSIILIPWLIWEHVRRSDAPNRPKRYAAIGLLVLIPSVVFVLPYSGGTLPLVGAYCRWRWGIVWSSQSLECTLTHWITKALSPGSVPAGTVAAFVTGPGLVMLVFGLLTIWLWRRGTDGSVLTAWVMLAGCLALFTMGVPFPWYLSWGWVVSLVRWNRMHMALSGVYLVLGFILTMAYTIPR